MKLKPERIGTFINFCFNIILGAVFSFYMLYINNALELRVFFISFAVSFAVGYTIGDLLPAPVWGDKVAKVFKLKETSIIYYLIKNLIVGICFVTAISFVMTWINVPAGHVIYAWLHTYPILLLWGYILVLIVMKPATNIALRLAGITSHSREKVVFQTHQS